MMRRGLALALVLAALLTVLPRTADAWGSRGVVAPRGGAVFVVGHPRAFVHHRPFVVARPFVVSPFVVSPFVTAPVIVAQPVWVPGAWFWNGFRWVWVPGRWAW